jgi:DNA-directed RNA polymerase subunit RPC12/RpoP
MKKTTEQYKKEVFDLVGNEYIVIGEYKNNKTKIRFKHVKCGLEYEVRAGSFLSNGNRCPHCSQRKTDSVFRKEVFDLVGNEYIFLDNYITNNKKISVKHTTCGHIYKVRPVHFLRGNRCPHCSRSAKTLAEYKQNVFDLVGDEYSVLGNYITNKTKILMKHESCGTKFETLPTNFLSLGNRCPHCFGNVLLTTEQFKNSVHDLAPDYEVLGEYINSETKILMKHLTCGHEYEVRPDDFKQGRRCPHCSLSGTSQQEQEVFRFIQSVYPGEIKRNYKNKLEIDIFIPDLNIGIEYDGLYWHSDEYLDKNYHIDKTKFFAEKGIRIIHIFEDEWLFKREIVESKLKHILGISSGEKIYARKCTIREISAPVKNKFLNENHIQGEDKSNVKLGLFYNDELVSVMTFGNVRVSLGKKQNSNQKELIRFASTKDKIVVGGFGKLLAHYKKNYDWELITTYADVRWSVENNVYKKTGFEQKELSKPNYWYFGNDKIRRHRFGFNKQRLKKLFPDIYSDSLTEHQIMDKTSYRRIYDCGNYVYEMRNEDE